MAVVTFTAVPGTTYHIAVDGIDGSRGNIQIGVSDEGGGAVLPANAVGIADFLNGGYKWMTTDLVASDVIDHPELITPDSGLVITGGVGATIPQLLGDIASYLLAGDWTIVLVWDWPAGGTVPISIRNTANTDPNNYDPAFETIADEFSFLASDAVSGNSRGVEDDVANSSPSVAAVTRTDAKIVCSFNGRSIKSVTSSQTGFAAAVNAAFVGGRGGTDNPNVGAMTLRRIVIYPPQADADLPGLSVLP